MILKILPNAWEMLDHRHPDAVQFSLITYARQHQHFRGVNRAKRQNDFMSSVDPVPSYSISTPAARFPSRTSLVTNACENRVEQIHARIASGPENGMPQKSVERFGLTAFRVRCLVRN